MRRMIAAGFALACFAATAASGQVAGRIEGTVTDTAKKPIPGAFVLVTGTTLSARADAQGRYTLEAVPAGTIQVEARKFPYKPRALAGLRVVAGQTISKLDFALESWPPGVGKIEGTVTDTAKRPIANAMVMIAATNSSIRTDAQGHYQIDNITAPAIVQVEARYVGYKPRALAGLQVPPGQTISKLDFVLEPAPVTLHEVNSVGSAGMLLRFQLIRPIATRTTDKVLMPIDSVLHDLFQWPGYQLLAQSAVTLDMPMPVIWGGTGASTSTQTMLNVDGSSYDLSIRADTTDVMPQRIKLTVSLAALSHAAATKSVVTTQLDRKIILSTAVTVNFGRTVVLGSTQPGGGRGGMNGTLILTVSPTVRPPNQ